MSTKLILLATITFLLIASTSSAPSPYYLVINSDTKQCGNYWGGDEFVNYDLPPGWDSYEYHYSDGYNIVETAFGTCKFPAMQTLDRYTETCCIKLGYQYVPDNIGTLRLTSENIANQKARNDSIAQLNAQARAKRNQTILLFSVAFLIVVLCVTLVARWRHNEKKQ